MSHFRSRTRNKLHNIRLVAGVEGPSVYINGRRVAGPKPWGGGDLVGEWWADSEDVLAALEADPDIDTVARRTKIEERRRARDTAQLRARVAPPKRRRRGA